ncbi:hypothetical protein [Nocardioides sp. GY 10127]|uniref:hypothetical protein n=1 Tax=Nocardioides sp. GY 10127 TaxID=2569762 RepID=UPI0010A8F45D|nr:hypothetical protein [Nocardioides sp. GY 10127]TIC78574.1 hypothetical protein E8D37_19575 [Nocardioides sp. GY 10127]
MRPSRPSPARAVPLLSIALVAGLGLASVPAAALAEPASPTSTRTPASLIGVPDVTGSGKVGTVLSVADPVWDTLGAVTTVQWQRGGADITGATGSDYTVQAADVGENLVAVLVATVGGIPVPGETVSTAPVLGLAGDAPTADAPTLDGDGVVGNVVSLDLASLVWDLLGVVSTYQWTLDGVDIPGETGTSYTPVVDDVDGVLALVVTGTLAGYDVGQVTSGGLTVLAAPLGAAPVLSQTPGLDGTPSVDALLSVDPSTIVWDLLGVDTTYQWTLDGVDIPGATGTSYTPLVGDLGHDLVVVVTGTLLDHEVGTGSSDPLTVLTGAAPTVDVLPTTVGKARAGRTLRVEGPTWSEAAAATTYQWMRDGSAIAGATGDRYKLRAKDVGHQVSVAATSAWEGHSAALATSDARTARKAVSTVKGKVLTKRVTRAKRAKMRVSVKALGISTKGGKVLVKDGKRTVAAKRITKASAGKPVVLRLKKLAPGKHRLLVKYTGTRGVAADTARVPVRVKRR